MEFLHFLAQYRTPALDITFQNITYLAQETFVILIICWLFWCSNKRLAYALGFSYFTSGLLIQGLKITFRIPRPWILDPGFKPVPSAISGATGYSFPSGHTQSSAALFGTFFLCAKKISYRIICLAAIALIMLSRMYLGVHTPKDVIVSFCLSAVCTALSHSCLYKRDVAEGHEQLITIIMSALCILLAAYAIILNRDSIITADYTADCIKAAGAGMAFSAGFYIERKYIRFEQPATRQGKIIRLLLGLMVTLLIQQGLKPVLGPSLAAGFVRYFLAVAWITILYPLLFRKCEKGRSVR